MAKKKIHVCQAQVVANEQLTQDCWALTLWPEKSLKATMFFPGQFVGLEPLAGQSTMVRPFSIAQINDLNNWLTIWYKVVGTNTQLMTHLHPQQSVKIWGPLGQKPFLFTDTYQADEVWLVAGGIGIAPLAFFERVIVESQNGLARIFYGVKTVKDIIKVEIETHSAEETIEIATEDGSVGYKGFITDLLAERLRQVKGQKILVITCGPNVMMKKVFELCQSYCLECFVLMESLMACGLGQCLGCALMTTQGQKHICLDGPLFKASEVIWP